MVMALQGSTGTMFIDDYRPGKLAQNTDFCRFFTFSFGVKYNHYVSR